MQTKANTQGYTRQCPYCDYTATNTTYGAMEETYTEHTNLEHLDQTLEKTENLVTLIREALVARYIPYGVADTQARKALRAYRTKHFIAGLNQAHQATLEAIEEENLA